MSPKTRAAIKLTKVVTSIILAIGSLTYIAIFVPEKIYITGLFLAGFIGIIYISYKTLVEEEKQKDLLVELNKLNK